MCLHLLQNYFVMFIVDTLNVLSIHFPKDTMSQKVFTSEKPEPEKIQMISFMFCRLTNWLIVAALQVTI